MCPLRIRPAFVKVTLLLLVVVTYHLLSVRPVVDSVVLEELVPHASPMLLLDELVSADEECIVCRVVVREDGLFDQDGRVPAWLGLEYMAQTVAAYSGFQAQRRGDAVKPGFLLGTRRFETSVDSFLCGEELSITVRRLMQDSEGLAAFECHVNGKGTSREMVQKAMLSVYEPSDASAFLQGTRN